METLKIQFNTKTLNDVINGIDLGIIGIIISVCFVVLTFISIFYILPSLKRISKKRKLEKEKLNKKMTLKRILIQKEIENEIEEEMKRETENKQNN